MLILLRLIFQLRIPQCPLLKVMTLCLSCSSFLKNKCSWHTATLTRQPSEPFSYNSQPLPPILSKRNEIIRCSNCCIPTEATLKKCCSTLNIYSETYFKAFSSISSRGADRVLVLGVDMVP
jgi:hypothetical protein